MNSVQHQEWQTATADNVLLLLERADRIDPAHYQAIERAISGINDRTQEDAWRLYSALTSN